MEPIVIGGLVMILVNLAWAVWNLRVTNRLVRDTDTVREVLAEALNTRALAIKDLENTTAIIRKAREQVK